MNINVRYPDLRTKLSVAFSYLPQRRSSDVLIAAHGRSGSTWLRTMLVNVMQPDADSNPDVFNRLIPAASIHTIHNMWNLSSPRILMSHTSYLPGLPKVVYLVRDGRDVLVSNYHQAIHRIPTIDPHRASESNISFSDFFDLYYQGRYRNIWHKNVESWLIQGQKALGERLLVIRFEDMKSDPIYWLSQVVQFSGMAQDAKSIEAAVQQTDLQKLREIEKQRWQAKGLGVPSEKTSFYRTGKSKNWEEYFTPELTERFIAYSAKAMKLAGYHP